MRKIVVSETYDIDTRVSDAFNFTSVSSYVRANDKIKMKRVNDFEKAKQTESKTQWKILQKLRPYRGGGGRRRGADASSKFAYFAKA